MQRGSERTPRCPGLRASANVPEPGQIVHQRCLEEWQLRRRFSTRGGMLLADRRRASGVRVANVPGLRRADAILLCGETRDPGRARLADRFEIAGERKKPWPVA